jgi:hypothetical protein
LKYIIKEIISKAAQDIRKVEMLSHPQLVPGVAHQAAAPIL